MGASDSNIPSGIDAMAPRRDSIVAITIDASDPMLSVMSCSDAFVSKCGPLPLGTSMFHWMQNSHDFNMFLQDETNFWLWNGPTLSPMLKKLVFKTPSISDDVSEFVANCSLSFEDGM